MSTRSSLVSLMAAAGSPSAPSTPTTATAWVVRGLTEVKEELHGGEYLCSEACKRHYETGGPSGVAVEAATVVPKNTRCRVCNGRIPTRG